MTLSIDTTTWQGAGDLTTRHAHPVHSVLREAARRTPHAPAVSDQFTTVDYAHLWDAARRTAGILRAQGVRTGDRVLIVADPRWEFAAVFYATAMIGAVAVPLNPQAKAFHVDHIRADTEPTLIIGPGGLGWDQLMAMAQAATPVSPVRTGPDDPAVLFFTSGSSAMPKGVLCTHGQIVFVAYAIAQEIPYNADDVVFVRSPLSFDYGCYQILLCAIAGAHLVLADPRDNAGFLRSLREVGATVIPAVPTMARLLLTLASRDDSPTKLRLLTNTGEHLDTATQKALGDRFPGLSLALMYGLTECKRASIELRGPGTHPTSTVGVALQGTAIAVLDCSGNPLPPGQVGQIAVAGPHVADGYWRDPELTARRFRRCKTTGVKVLITGDLGEVDEDGLIRVHGREDDVFKNNGVRVSALEIEAAALDVRGVTAAGVGLPVDQSGAVLWVSGEVHPNDVLSALHERLEPARVPTRCRRAPRLPETSSGKVDRRTLAQWGKRAW